MTIISISLKENILAEVKKLEENNNFKGRSEVIRTALNLLIDEQKSRSLIKGNIDAVLLIKHDEKHSEKIMELRHKNVNLIQTHIHTHLENHECLEFLILKGDSKKIKRLTENLESNKKVKLAKLIVL